MAYTKPRIEIQEDFTSVPVFSEKPLAALIIGPQYQLVRYNVASEKASAAVVNPDGTSGNAYVPGSDVVYPYPTQASNSVVDQDYVKVYFDKAEAKYFPLSSLGSASDVVTKITNYPNRVHSSALVFKTANGTNRSSVFSNRDVAIGDVVVINDGGSNSLKSTVKSLVADIVASSLSSVSNSSTNKATVAEDYNDAIGTGGSYGTVTTSNTSTSYDGHPDLGIVADTFTATVTTAGNLSAVRFSVASAAGAFATVTDAALATNVLNLDVSSPLGLVNNVKIDFTSSTAFTLGMTFTLSVVAAVTQVTPTVAGTYTGAKDLTYTGVIVRGGPAYNGSNAGTCAQIKFTSTDTDTSGPTNVLVSTAFNVGSYGTTISFGAATSNGKFILGDSYYFTATASTNGAVRTLVLKDNLTTALLGATTLYVQLFESLSNTQISQVTLPGNVTNWVTEDTQITINSGITVTDSSLIATDLSLAALPIAAAKVYVQYRALLKTNSNALGSIANSSGVSLVLGPVTPDNPLAQGVYNATLNSGGVAVYYGGVPTDDIDGYNAILGISKKTNKVYGITPLTYDSAIQDAVKSNVTAASNPLQAQWRVSWLAKPIVKTSGLYTLKSGGDSWLATVSDNPVISGTQYTLFTVAGATFITDGVRSGDVVRYNYETNSDGSVSYSSFVVSEVRSETTLVTETGLSAAVTIAKKFELWRVYSLQEQADNYAAVAGSANDRRVRIVLAGTFKSAGVSMDGYFAAACLSGLRSGVAPQEPLTNVEIAGIDDLSDVLAFSEDQLDEIAGSGVWIVTQDAVGAVAYSRHQLTSDMSSTKTAEDSFTSNVDSVAYGLQSKLEPFIGKYNISPESMAMIQDTVNAELRFRQTNTYTSRGGYQLLGGTGVTSFTQNAVFRDRLDIAISLNVPYPFNYGFITLSV